VPLNKSKGSGVPVSVVRQGSGVPVSVVRRFAPTRQAVSISIVSFPSRENCILMYRSQDRFALLLWLRLRSPGLRS